MKQRIETLAPLITSVLAILATLLVAGLLLLSTGFNPIESLGHLFSAGWGCSRLDQCPLLTTLQFATPLLFTGLSATLAFRAGVFSVGQAGQMLLGAALAASLGSRLSLPGIAHPIVAMLGGALAGAAWAWIVGALKVYLNINEVIVALVLNQLAAMLVGSLWLGRVEESARLASLASGTKLNAGIVVAVLATGMAHVWLWHFASGYEQRMAGQSPLLLLLSLIGRAE